MERTIKETSQRIIEQREDGEEAIHQHRKVVPLDSGKGNESAEGNANTTSHTDKPRESGG
ncbi:MAG: hypothetical protein JST79_18355 [Acidobacteria bacterium]|nr:hypothetical protein [Acidobacteriota bacterium]